MAGSIQLVMHQDTPPPPPHKSNRQELKRAYAAHLVSRNSLVPIDEVMADKHMQQAEWKPNM
jgi:hypothetical protein